MIDPFTGLWVDGDEHPVYWTTGGFPFGEEPDNLRVSDWANNGVAVFWCGGDPADTKKVEAEQIAAKIAELVDYGWHRGNIYVFWGLGKTNVGHPLFVHRNATPPIELWSARRCNLQKRVIDRLEHIPVDLVFFFASGHGYSTAPGAGGGRGLEVEKVILPYGQQQAPSLEIDPQANSTAEIGDGDGPAQRGGCAVLDPLGGCCLGNGLCTKTTQADCAAMAGLWGEGSPCAAEVGPVDVLVDPFLGPCLLWVNSSTDALDYSVDFQTPGKFSVLDVTPDPGGFAPPVLRLARIIQTAQQYEAQIIVDWVQASVVDQVTVSWVLAGSDGKPIVQVGIQDTDSGASPVAFAQGAGAPVFDTAVGLVDGAVLRLHVIKANATEWDIVAWFDGFPLLFETTTVEATSMELRVRRSDDAGVPSGIVNLDHATFGPIATDSPPSGIGDTPRGIQLYAAAPNPMRSSTDIRFDVPSPTHVRLRVFDVTGRAVRELENRLVSTGQHRVTWDGKTDDGGRATAGMYFYRLEAGDFSDTQRLVLLK